MKYKEIEAVKVPKKPKKGNAVFTEYNEYILLDIWRKGVYAGRYAINHNTYENGVYRADTKLWHQYSLDNMFASNFLDRGYYATSNYIYNAEDMEFPAGKSKEWTERIKDLLGARGYRRDAKDCIQSAEYDYRAARSNDREERKQERIDKLMSLVDPDPKGFGEWVESFFTENYAFPSDNGMICTSCKQEFEKDRAYKHGSEIACPKCGEKLKVKIRGNHFQCRSIKWVILQDCGQDMKVERYGESTAHWGSLGKVIQHTEISRYVYSFPQWHRARARPVYYNQALGSYYVYPAEGWNNGNTGNLHPQKAYLFPRGIREALQDTNKECWTYAFEAMADKRIPARFTDHMWYTGNHWAGTLEMLVKGRFYKLAEYLGDGANIRPNGRDIHDTLGIKDKQLINRLRDMNGGSSVLSWLRYQDKSGRKISQKALEYYEKEDIIVNDAEGILEVMSPDQVANYLIKQQETGYKGQKAAAILDQWKDYMDMCSKLKKDLTDEMVYRPRELKRRHDEAVAEIELMRAELDAKEMAKKYPGTEKVLRAIAPRFEYKGRDYFIKVPRRLVEIVSEGRLLHHCVGSTDRYFDRIKSHETYICFLRKTAEPDIPFYTIEVEPGGTIRQHRGYLDEEPELEAVKPFLREWQREIKKRMTDQDREKAARSKVLREENIKQLKKDKNLRVLNGLMEDFMEAI